MKGITLCADCAYYSMGMHSCRRGATDEGEPTARFYADCPLDDVVPVVRGRWVHVDENEYSCSECRKHVCFDQNMDGSFVVYNLCPFCGAKMDKEV